MKKRILNNRNEPSFPMKWLTVVVFLEMILIGIGVWHIGFTEVLVREGMTKQVKLERLHGDIIHLDEVLTMSAKMAAVSGDLEWEERYLNYEPLLNEKINAVMRESETLNVNLIELGISTTNEANSRLVMMEQDAFKHVRNKQPEKARELLFSEAYKENKAHYADGMEMLLSRLDLMVINLIQKQKDKVKLIQIFGVLGWVLLITVWVGVLMGIKTWRRTLLEAQGKLSSQQTLLEQRVTSMAKDLTLAEHRERQRIAGLLHDQLQQILVAARLQLSLLDANKNRDQIDELLGQSINVSRTLTNELNPPGLMLVSFADALNWLSDWVREKHGLITETQIQNDLPNVETEVKIVTFDAIREIMFNIVKHSQTTKSEIIARTDVMGKVQIIVIDDGVGFDPNIIRSGEGFGLLNTIRRLELIGGKLDLSTGLGKGCEAIITLPVITSDSKNYKQVNPVSKIFEKTKVLVVDDHPIVRLGVINALKSQSGLELREAGGMKEVVQNITDFTPDVAILDVSLGKDEPTGEDVAKYLKSRFDNIRMIAFTSYEDVVSREQMLSAGVSEYLVKGCPTSELIEAVQG